MITWHCVNCDTLLVEAPTDKGHMDCGPHGKICFDCIDRMAFYLAKRRAAVSAEEIANGSVALQPGQHQHTNDVIAFCIFAACELKDKGYVTIDKNTGWGNMLEGIAQQRHL